MRFWILMLVMDYIIPITMICMGIYFLKCNFHEFLRWFGMETDTYKIAQKIQKFAWRSYGKAYIICGIAMSVLFTAVIYPARDMGIGMMARIGGTICFIQGALLIASIILIKRRLKMLL